jgi:ribonucleoside-diphosphate reductase alpha chain
MINCKTGNWFIENPQRGRSNNSVKLLKSDFTKEEFDSYKESIKQFGEPGIAMVNDIDFCTNPCFEVGFKPINPFTGKSCISFCNLNEIIGSHCKTEQDFYYACKAAAILGTFQASYTEFSFLGKDTEELVKWEALLGISITGIMNNPHVLTSPDILRKGAEIVKETNKIVAELIGINQSARTTVVKPSGNASVLAKTASGIHPAHAHNYFRTIQLNKETPVAKYLSSNYPELLEEGVWSSTNSDYACFIPIQETKETIVKSQIDELKFLETVKIVYENWVLPGSNKDLGYSNTITHNVSNTVSVTDWDKTFDYIYDNKEYFCGLSFLPNSGDKIYHQSPFTEVLTQEELISQYGDAALFASGLIVDALHCFNNNLWDVCSAVTNKSFVLSGDRITVMVKKEILTRIKKFAKNYFKGDLQKTTDCLKDIHLYHKWVKVNRVLKNKPVDFSKVQYTNSLLNADELSGAACSSGQCEITF